MDRPIIDEETEVQNDSNVQVAKSRKYFLEVATILLFYGKNLPSTLLQNQLLKQTCFQQGYNETICNELSANSNETKDIEKLLQPHVAQINVVIELIRIVPAILALFFGPWSDIYGRRPILISSFTGFASTLMLFAVICYSSETFKPNNPWLYVYANIPEVLSGGWTSLLTTSLCYITDTTEESRRAYRITLFEMIIFFGVLMSTLTANTIITLTDVPTVFIISAVMAALGTIILIIFVDESIEVPQNVTICDKVKNLLSPIQPICMIKTCFKRRPFNERKIVLSLIAILMLTVFTNNGNITVSYLYERQQFGWQLKDANYFDSVGICVVILGCFIGLRLFKKVFGVSEIYLMILALVSAIFNDTLKAFATLSWQMYAASALTLFRILSSPMSRTIITQIVPHDEIGKIFSLTTSFEGLSSFASAPLYAYVYTKSLDTFPGAFFLISSAVFVINLALALWVFKMKRARESLINPYDRIENE
jgi:MFS transporter, PCFT/HCP family, solute carrier family 46 (folate transporter), member 1